MTGRRKGRTRIGGHFAPRLIEMLELPAYRTLSLSARRLLDRLEIELAHHGGEDNGRLPTTYEHFCEYGMDRHCIGPAIREAVALGFLEVTERGRAGNAEFRKPSLYRLTYRHTRRADPTDDWRRIETIEQAEMLAKSSRKQKPSGVSSQVSVRETPAENVVPMVRESPNTAHRGRTITTSISRGGDVATNTGARAPQTLDQESKPPPVMHFAHLYRGPSESEGE